MGCSFGLFEKEEEYDTSYMVKRKDAERKNAMMMMMVIFFSRVRLVSFFIVVYVVVVVYPSALSTKSANALSRISGHPGTGPIDPLLAAARFKSTVYDSGNLYPNPS